jgi:hypothetical protein
LIKIPGLLNIPNIFDGNTWKEFFQTIDWGMILRPDELSVFIQKDQFKGVVMVIGIVSLFIFAYYTSVTIN